MRQPLRAAVDLHLDRVARVLGIEAPEPIPLGGVATDSRDVRPGDLFVALGGERHDGHDFAARAVAQGAVAVLAAREVSVGRPVLRVDDTLAALQRLATWWRRECGARLVAVTGSNGKTTTKEMIAAVFAEHLGAAGRVMTTPGNFNNHVGVPLTLLGGRPDQALGVVELGMNAPGEIDHLAGIVAPEVGVVTNASDAHLARFGAVEGVARAKAEIWGRLGPAGVAVAPADDPRLVALARERFAGRVVLFGATAGAEVRICRSTPDAAGLEVELEVAGEPLRGRLALHGRHQAQNAAAAAAACLALAIPAATVARGLSRTAALPHRATLLSLHGVQVLDDCYNANPASVRAAVRTLLELPGGGRAGVVLGDMLELGEDAGRLHRELGRELAELGVTAVVGLGPLSRELCAGAREAGLSRVAHVEAVAEAVRVAGELFAAGDRVLVKGSRRMGLEQVLDAWAARLPVGEEVA